jgi:hypothetical protein
MDDTTHFDSCVYDALDRYKRLNGTDYDINIIQPLLSILKENFKDDAIRRIAFYDDAAKIHLDFLEKEFIIDWDYEDTPAVFVASMEEETLMIKDGTLEELPKIIKSYYNQ